MKRTSFSRVLLTITLLIVFLTAGCSQAAKKRLVTVEDELSKVQTRVSTLEAEKASWNNPWLRPARPWMRPRLKTTILSLNWTRSKQSFRTWKKKRTT